MPIRSQFLFVPIVLAGIAAWPVPGRAEQQPSAPAVAEGLGRTALSDSTAYALLESLTTDIGPRLAGTASMARAAAWAEMTLKGAGLQDVHREAFPMAAWRRGLETARVVVPYEQNLAITALGGSVATPPDGIEAPIALFRTYAELLAAQPGSLAGKIAVVTQRTARTQDGAGYGANYMVRWAGASEAAKRGAVAYLLRSLGPENHRLPHTGRMKYSGDAPKIPAAALSNPDADQLERLSAKGPVRLKLVLTPTISENAQSWNVVGEVKGREKPDEIVLIGAHLDSWDLGTGASDDGAGVAIVSAAARLIARLPQHPRRTVRVVLFGAEEMDVSGAAYGAAHALEAAHIALMGESDFGATPVFAARLPAGLAGTPFAAALSAALTPLGVYFDPRPTTEASDDLRPLHVSGVPVIGLQQDGRDYFDTHHSADDTFDKIDSRQLAQAVAVWAESIYLAAEDDGDFRAQPAK